MQADNHRCVFIIVVSLPCNNARFLIYNSIKLVDSNNQNLKILLI